MRIGFVATLAASVLALADSAQAQTTGSDGGASATPVERFGKALADDGITFNSRYLGEFAANPSGGARRGSAFTGELSLGADLDLAKLAGDDGGLIHVLFTDRAGSNLAAHSINNSISVQQIYGDGQTWQLTTLSYAQKLFRDRIEFEVGRIDLNEDTGASKLYCDFQSNDVCGNAGFFGKDANIGSSYYPLATWGGRVRFNLTPQLYVKTAVYQSAPNENPAKTHGFDWRIDRSDGVQVPVEVGFEDAAPGATIHNRFDIGAIFDQTRYAAPYYSATSPTQFERSVVYAEAQKLVYQPDGDTARGLYLFASALVGDDGQKDISDYSYEVGGVYQGASKARPLDYIGFVINALHYNRDYLQYEYQTRLSESGLQRPHADLIMAELNYSAQLTPWLNLMPNLQYTINPDGLGGRAYPTANEKDAFIIGVQFNLGITRLLGLSEN